MIELPQDPHAERALLSTLCAPGAEQALAVYIPVLVDEDFMVPAHRSVLRAIRQLLNAGQEVNSITLFDTLASAGNRLDRSDLVDIISGEEVGRPENVVSLLQGKRKQRELISLAWNLFNASQTTPDPKELIAEFGANLTRLGQNSDKGNVESINRFSDDALALVADRMDGKSQYGTKIQGWPRLNGLTHGFQPGQLIVLAARPGIGKTALALNWILRAAELGKRCAVFSLEMGKEELWNRMVSDQSGVNYREMIERRDMDAFSRFARGKVAVDELPIHVGDRGKITVQEIAGQVDRILARHDNLGLVVIDYLQLLSSGASNKSQTETIRIGEITRSLKIMAKDRRVPVLLLSQLNRESDKRTGGKPQLTDLRDSGCIEQDSDLVMFIHRTMNATNTDLIVAKHRNGPCMTLPLTFKPELTRYQELERTTEDWNPSPEPLAYLQEDYA